MAHSSDIRTSPSRMKYLGDDDVLPSKACELQDDFTHSSMVGEGGNDAHTSIQMPEIANRWLPEADRSTSIGISSLETTIQCSSVVFISFRDIIYLFLAREKGIPLDFSNHVSITRGSESALQIVNRSDGQGRNRGSSPMPVTIKVLSFLQGLLDIYQITPIFPRISKVPLVVVCILLKVL
jgi:hypothetical protein